MRKRGTYAICILMVMLLICGAFFAPGIAMKVYDYQKTQSYEFQFRPGIDYEAVNTMYETERAKRLMNYAQGLEEGGQYYITATDMEPDSWEEILGGIYSQDIVLLLSDMGLMWMTEAMVDSENITDWNYYMIYDKDGAAFLCWYLEIQADGEILRILADARDYTVYYVEIYNEGIQYYYQERLSNQKSVVDWFWQDILVVKEYYGGEIIYNADWYNEEKTQAVTFDKEEIIKKKYYGGEYGLSSDLKEITSDIIFDTGTLQLNASFLRRYGEYYGLGVGIEELRDMLPQEKAGVLLESVG